MRIESIKYHSLYRQSHRSHEIQEVLNLINGFSGANLNLLEPVPQNSQPFVP